MAFNKTFDRLERLAWLIYRKSTGTPEELAVKLEVSVRTVFNLLDILRYRGAEIVYCRDRRTYAYAEPVEICFDLFKPLGKIETVCGGRKYSYNFFLTREISYDHFILDFGGKN